MCDNVTAIAYRHSPEEVEYCVNRTKFKEYSKNWRQCIYIDSSNGNFVASRQYPRTDETIAKSVRELLEETICNYFNYKNSWKVSSNRSFIMEYMKNYDIEDYSEWDDGDGSQALHYNDIWHGFDGKIVYNKEEDNIKDTEILVGCEPICPICGKRKITEHDMPFCIECSCIEF